MEKVIIPRESVSDNSYKIVSILFTNHQQVKKNDLLGEIESSKAILEILSPADGYVFTDRKTDEQINVGDIFCFVSESKFDPNNSLTTYVNKTSDDIGSSRFSQKASELIEKHKLDAALFNDHPGIVSERDVLRILTPYLDYTKKEIVAIDSPQKRITRVGIIGGGAGALQVIDLMLSNGGYVPVAIFDDTAYKLGKSILGVPVLSNIDEEKIYECYNNNVFDQLIISISTSIDFREKVFNQFKAKNIPFATLIHRSVHVGFNVSIGEGNIVFPNCHIGTCTVIGDNNFITAMSSIEHSNVLGSHCTFGPGVMTSGNVVIGDRNKFGAGVFIEPYVNIGDNCKIASGIILRSNISSFTAVTDSSSIKQKKLDE